MDDLRNLVSPLDAERITRETVAKYQRYVSPSALSLLRLGGFDQVEWSGQGALLTDVQGKTYIDCLGGYGVFSLGHAHPKVVEAVIAQMRRLPLSSKTFLNKPLADLSELLAKIAPGDLQYSFLCNSGTEGVEASLKFARMATRRIKIVSANGSFHGKTMGALSASGRKLYKEPFEPLLPGFVQVPFGDVDALTQAVDDTTAAVLLEPIQGENGIQIPPLRYLTAARRLCNRHGALLILDEVQTGLGRTGRMFAAEHWGVAADLMPLAKALGGGVLPVGAVMGTPAIWEAVFRENPYLHSSTFGGSEIACVAAITAIQVTIDEDLPAQAVAKGALLLQGLREIQTRHADLVTEARGMGLMIGVEFRDSDIGKLIIGALVQRGVIAAYTLNNPCVLRFEPPLTITEAQISRVLVAFDEALDQTRTLIRELLYG